MFKLHCEMTLDDIACGIVGSARRCPGTQCVERAASGRLEQEEFQVWTTRDSVRVVHRTPNSGWREARAATPQVLAEFIDAFDERLPVTPIVFDLEFSREF